MNKPLGLAALTIDSFFLAKLFWCRAYDAAWCFEESDLRSAVGSLKAFYLARRPQFVETDEAWGAFFQMIFPPPKGRRAIKDISASHFGQHKVIRAEFG